MIRTCKDQIMEVFAAAAIVALLFWVGYTFGAAVGNTAVAVLR